MTEQGKRNLRKAIYLFGGHRLNFGPKENPGKNQLMLKDGRPVLILAWRQRGKGRWFDYGLSAKIDGEEVFVLEQRVRAINSFGSEYIREQEYKLWERMIDKLKNYGI